MPINSAALIKSGGGGDKSPRLIPFIKVKKPNLPITGTFSKRDSQ